MTIQASDIKSISIDDLIIETTRRCNFKCKHCLRGPQQNIDFNTDLLHMFFKHAPVTPFLNGIVFTGGEPSLAANIIENTRHLLRDYEVDYGSFYIATNGSGNNDPVFINEALSLFLQSCDPDNCTSLIQMSSSQFHKEYWDKYGIDDGMGKLGQLKFVEPKPSGKWDYSSVLNEGRAKHINYMKKYDIRIDELCIEFEDGHLNIGNEVYINCKGNTFVGYCDLSYKSQDRKKFIFSHVDNFWDKILSTVA
jgi:hypothetical protein